MTQAPPAPSVSLPSAATTSPEPVVPVEPEPEPEPVTPANCGGPPDAVWTEKTGLPVPPPGGCFDLISLSDGSILTRYYYYEPSESMKDQVRAWARNAGLGEAEETRWGDFLWTSAQPVHFSKIEKAAMSSAFKHTPWVVWTEDDEIWALDARPL